jgi:hypothetical protein
VCEDLGAAIQYPQNNAPPGATASIVSYATTPPPSGGWGTPPSGSVLWYISTQFNGNASSITFSPGKKVVTISSHRLSPTNSYSLYFYASGAELGSPEQLGSPNCKVTCTLKGLSPLDGETVPAGLTIWFEVVQN